MIPLVFAQLAARWGQALTLLMLSLVATVAVGGMPAYAAAVDQAAIDNELATGDRTELSLSLPLLSREWEDPPADLPAHTAALAELTSFTPVTTVEILVEGAAEGSGQAHRLLARDGFCAHVTYRAGRCPVGGREVALPAGLAADLDLRTGHELVLTPVLESERGLQQDGPPVAITLVGVFEARDPADPYWAPQDPLGSAGINPAMFTNRTALQTIEHQRELVHVDATLPAHRLTPELVPALRDQLETAEDQLAAGGVAAAITTGLPRLLDRITGTGDQARALLPIAAAPLLALSWLVVYLAVGHGVAGRRHEVAVVTLRGQRPDTRAVAVTAESLLPVLAGVPAGLALIPLLAAAAGPGPAGAFTVDNEQLLAAAVATVGSVAAVLLALRHLTAPVLQLLRRVPPRQVGVVGGRRRHRRGAVVAVEALVAVLALWVVTDLRALDGELVGVMVVAPALVMLAVAALAARAVRPVIDRAGRWSLRRGRLGPAMAALYLARRPGAARLLLVLALAFGMLGFAVIGADVAAQGRAAEAEQRLGAARVLEVQRVTRGALLAAVRAADPTGRYAMAVASVPPGSGGPPALAVDATRLEVALWPERYGSLGPAEVAEQLRPPAPEPAQVDDGALTAELSAELSLDPTAGERPEVDRLLSVSLLLVPAGGSVPVAVDFAPIRAGEPAYRAEVTGCEPGCRVAGLTVTMAEPGDSPVPATEFPGSVSEFEVTVAALRQQGRDVLPPEWLADADRWRVPEQGAPDSNLVEGEPSGLHLVHRRPRTEYPYPLLIADAPYPLPVVGTGEPPAEVITGIDGHPIRADRRASLAGLPGLQGSGLLMDLEYAERLSARPGHAQSPQVWLAADAPVRVVDRLEEQGLVVTGEHTVAGLRGSLEESGAALALRFFRLAGAVAVLLGLGALALVTVVDRRTWSQGLRVLRAQGLAERTTAAAALWSYGGAVVAGTVAGALAAVAAWLAAGDRLPVGLDASAATVWPRWTQLLVPWAVAVAVLLVAAVAGAWWQRASVRGEEVARQWV